MKSICGVILLMVVGFATVSAFYHFQSYNNEERQKFLSSYKETHPNSLGGQQYYEKHEKRLLSKGSPRYDPTWESIDSRPLPAWYDQSKVGIFIHWGVYSVPGVNSEWFWKQWTDGNEDILKFMNANYKPGFTYQDFGREFTTEFYDPAKWADLFSRSGARYVVLTSKHHEGYTLWPSRYSFSWNAMDVGPHRDLLGELATEIRANTSLKFGLYHSLFEWYNPLWMSDKNNSLNTSQFVDFKAEPEMYELVEKYQPEILWSDGEWEASDDYWRSKEFIAWLYNDSPVKDTVVTNDRWGTNTLCTHGGFYTCADRYNPGVLQPHKWENCFTLDKHSWGNRRNAYIEDYLKPEELITIIIESVSCGGNVLVNVGPTYSGMIPAVEQQLLLQMGEWLGINGEAIYNTIPHVVQNDTVTPGVWYTASADETKYYGMLTTWPGESVHLGSVNSSAGLTINMFGSSGDLQWEEAEPGVVVTLPRPDEITSKWAWTLVFSNF